MKHFIKKSISILLMVLAALLALTAIDTWRELHTDFSYPKEEVYVMGIFKDYYSSRSKSTRIVVQANEKKHIFRANVNDEFKKYRGREVKILLSDEGYAFNITAVEDGKVLKDASEMVQSIEKTKERGIGVFYLNVFCLAVMLLIIYLLRKK